MQTLRVLLVIGFFLIVALTTAAHGQGLPSYKVDPSWPKQLPNNWIMGQVGGISADEFATLNKSLHRLERFWTDQILYRL